MDPLHFAIATIPLAVYFLLIGIINIRRRPFVTTGARDLAALGIGIGGLVVVGPMELFFPEAASRLLGFVVWIMLLAFYGLCIALVVLLLRPRIVVYNSSVERIRNALSEILLRVDKKARWVGDTLILPTLNVRLNVEGGTWLNNVQLVAIGNQQSLEGWRKIEKELRMELRASQAVRGPLGYVMITAGVILAIFSMGWIVVQRQEVARSFVEMFRL